MSWKAQAGENKLQSLEMVYAIPAEEYTNVEFIQDFLWVLWHETLIPGCL